MNISLEEYGKLSDRITELMLENERLRTIVLATQQWISVKDRLPGHRAMYITCDEFNIVEVTMFDGNEDVVWNTVAETKVMHWMPLPEPPEVEDAL